MNAAIVAVLGFTGLVVGLVLALWVFALLVVVVAGGFSGHDGKKGSQTRFG